MSAAVRSSVAATVAAFALALAVWLAGGAPAQAAGHRVTADATAPAPTSTDTVSPDNYGWGG